MHYALSDNEPTMATKKTKRETKEYANTNRHELFEGHRRRRWWCCQTQAAPQHVHPEPCTSHQAADGDLTRMRKDREIMTVQHNKNRAHSYTQAHTSATERRFVTHGHTQTHRQAQAHTASTHSKHTQHTHRNTSTRARPFNISDFRGRAHS